MDIGSLIQQYGYLAVLLGSLLEGETVLVLAGLAAHLGYLSLPLVIATAALGGSLGDQIAFLLGRRQGRKLLARRPAWQAKADGVLQRLQRHQNLVLLTCRFWYGLRIVTPFAAGMSHIAGVRFVALNLLGAVLWAGTIGGLGYLFGQAAEAALGEIRHIEIPLFAGIALVGLLFWAHARRRRRRTHSHSPGDGAA